MLKTRFHQLCAATALSLVMLGCASLGVPSADTWNKKVVAAYATTETLAKSAGELRASGRLSDVDRANAVTTLRAANTEIALADSLYAQACPPPSPPTGCDTAATNKLNLAVGVLAQLQAYLSRTANNPK